MIWRLIRATCEEFGELYWEASGEHGLATALETKPDVVILDIGLPRMDGWGVLTGIREDPATRYTPVLVLTAHADGASREKAKKGEASAFMTKPFRPRDLRTALAVLLEVPITDA